ncbi:MAG: hypothetical protein LQ350_007314 [Teloschistes chrysophthalmus]|nr:MAG: hypothetical protein LQ350_007314 [Niorma chrysophthalma]
MASKSETPINDPQTPSNTREPPIVPPSPAQDSPFERRRAPLFTAVAAGPMPVEQFLYHCTYHENAWPTLSSLQPGNPNWKSFKAFKTDLVRFLTSKLGNQWHSVNLLRATHQMSDGDYVVTEVAINVVVGVAPGTVHDWQGLASVILEDFVDWCQGPERPIGVLFMPTFTDGPRGPRMGFL